MPITYCDDCTEKVKTMKYPDALDNTLCAECYIQFFDEDLK